MDHQQRGNSPGERPAQLSKGVFSVSLDFELIWGTIDKPNWRAMRDICLVERQEIVGRLLELFHQYSVSATWCTVGHLFLQSCSAKAGEKHPEILDQACIHGGGRFDRDPCSNEGSEPSFYGRQLIRQILDCPTPQEIGSHSFSHANFSACTRQSADTELRECVRAAGELGLRLSSFAFPRNRVGHLDVLASHGIEVFRGPDRTWHETAPRRRWYHRLGHLADIALAVTPPTVLPEWNPNGLWDIPGSMLYTPSHGPRRFVPVGLRVSRARKGLRAAARDRRIFHLWFHPTDVVVRKQAMLDGLARVLDTAGELRDKGQLVILPLREIPRFENLRPARPTQVTQELAS